MNVIRMSTKRFVVIVVVAATAFVVCLFNWLVLLFDVVVLLGFCFFVCLFPCFLLLFVVCVCVHVCVRACVRACVLVSACV